MGTPLLPASCAWLARAWTVRDLGVVLGAAQEPGRGCLVGEGARLGRGRVGAVGGDGVEPEARERRRPTSELPSVPRKWLNDPPPTCPVRTAAYWAGSAGDAAGRRRGSRGSEGRRSGPGSRSSTGSCHHRSGCPQRSPRTQVDRHRRTRRRPAPGRSRCTSVPSMNRLLPTSRGSRAPTPRMPGGESVALGLEPIRRAVVLLDGQRGVDRRGGRRGGSMSGAGMAMRSSATRRAPPAARVTVPRRTTSSKVDAPDQTCTTIPGRPTGSRTRR